MMKLLSRVKLFVLFFLAVFSFFSFQSSFAQTEIGQMVWVKGSVQASGGGPARTLQRRSPIYEHDTIVTNSGAGEIIFTDNSTVTLNQGTTFRIDEYKFSSSSSDNRYVAGLAKGGFRTITGLISKSNPTGYQVNTPVATIGVRGTDYSAFYSASRGLSVHLLQGALFVTNPAGTAELSVARGRVDAQISNLRTAPQVKGFDNNMQYEKAPVGGRGGAQSVTGFCVD